jgi:hypothetical protein
MKAFERHKFNPKQYEQELNDFEVLLSSKRELGERKDILPFFTQRRDLSLQISTIVPSITVAECIAYEFDFFGNFKCDLAVGDINTHSYCFIEFENGRHNSLFCSPKPTSRFLPEFAPRFERGMSQIMDWFYDMDGRTEEQLRQRFGNGKIHYEGLLVIGRDNYIDSSMSDRLHWRSQNVVVNSKKALCLTYDQLYASLRKKWDLLKEMMKN